MTEPAKYLDSMKTASLDDRIKSKRLTEVTVRQRTKNQCRNYQMQVFCVDDDIDIAARIAIAR